MTAPENRLIDCNTLAGILGVDRSTVWRKAARGDLPKPIRVAGLTRWRLADIEAAISGAAREDVEAV